MSALEDALRNPPRIPAVGDSSPLTGLARRRISRLDILAHSVAAIGPSSGALIGTVVAAQVAGRGVWLAVLLAMAVSWTLAQVFGQYGSRIAGSGSLYTFVAHAAGPRVSLAVMCALAIGYGVLAGFGAAQTAEHLVSAVAPPLVHAPPLASLAVLGMSVHDAWHSTQPWHKEWVAQPSASPPGWSAARHGSGCAPGFPAARNRSAAARPSGRRGRRSGCFHRLP